MANSEIYTLTQVDDTTTYTLSYVQDGVTTEIVDIEGLSFDEEGSKEDFLNAIDIQSYDDAGTTKYKIYLTNEALAFSGRRSTRSKKYGLVFRFVFYRR